MIIIYILYWLLMLCFQIIRNKRMIGSIISPYVVFHVSWLLPPLLFLWYATEYQEFVLSEWFYLFLILVDFLFFLGEMISWGLAKRKNRPVKDSTNQIFNDMVWRNILGKRLTIISLVAISAGILNIAHAIFIVGVTPFSVDLRTWEYAFGWSTAINYLYFLNLIAGPLMMVRVSFFGKKRYYIFTLIHTLFLFFHGIKATVIMGLMLYVFFYVFNPFSKRKNTLNTLLLIIVVGIGTFISFFVVSYLRLSVTAREMFSFIDIVNLTIKKLLLYLLPNYANLELAITDGPRLIGQYLMNKLLVISTLGIVETKYTYDNVIPLVNRAYTVGTFLRDFVLDFGVVAAFFSFYISFIVNIFYNKFLRQKNFFTLVTISVLFTMVGMSFWYNEFIRPQFIFFILISWLINYLSKGRVSLTKKRQNLKQKANKL